jgi:hypothetical protein
MTTWLLPIGATLAAAMLTYFFCMRPMRSGRHCLRHREDPRVGSASDADLREEIRQAREELARLRAGESPPGTW